jgi:hypothetical protein
MKTVLTSNHLQILYGKIFGEISLIKYLDLWHMIAIFERINLINRAYSKFQKLKAASNTLGWF